MTAKVGPTESDQNMAGLSPQQSDLKGVKGSKDIKEHHDDAEYNKEVTWIQKHIKMRQCSYYIPSDNKDICQCRYGKTDHIQNLSSPHKQEVESPSTNLKWKFSNHTCAVPTNAFGEIEFEGFGGNIGKFVRVDRETEMNTMYELMTIEWKMEKPDMLISVTGSAKKDFNMKPYLRDVLRCGIIKAAHSTGAWIITGGTHVGVMKQIGEAVQDYNLTSINQKPVVAIGIAPWGIIQNRKALENEEGSWPAKYHIEEDMNPEESFLDPNHSHFILVDDGTQHKYNTEIRFRSKLEQKISQMKTGDDAMSVPIVILIIEGGKGTLKTVKNALKRDTPAVIVKGSGRAADILAYAFNNAKTVDAKDNQGKCKIIKVMERSLEDEICKQIKDMELCKEEKIGDTIQQIKDCLEKFELIHIFEWDSGNGARDIDVAILRALLKAKKYTVLDQLKLALSWNRADIAKSEIFTDEKRWTASSLDKIMLSAVQQNRVNFVQLFLDNGVSLKKLLTIKKLQKLYKKFSSRSLLTLISKKRQKKNNEEITLKEVGQLMEDLLGESYLPHYISDSRYANSNVEEHPDRVQNEKSKEPMSMNDTVNCVTGRIPEDSEKAQKPKPDNPEQELFIWSVLNTQQEMAKLFWQHGKDAIAAALVASALLYAMARQTDDEDKRTQIKANASEFTNLAIAVLKECNSTDEKKAQFLLIQELSQWANTTCVQIAVKAKNMKFISQTACQDLFNNIWSGKIDKEISTVKLLICCAIPPLIPCLVKLKENEDGDDIFYEKSKSPHPGGKSSEQSHRSQHPQGTKDHPGDETKRCVTCCNIVKKFASFYKAPVVIFFLNVIKSSAEHDIVSVL